ncbi:MAG TPA: VWA domain-containing protein [Thermoanaerobaculia bacterium]|nr:VWA domain-containing protein [Thermoanaerobaculia bacterium]
MRRTLLLTLLLAFNVNAATTFVSPLPGAQVVGPAWIEVTTDAKSVDRIDFFVDGVLAGVARKAPYRIAYDFGATLTPRTITAKVWTNGFKSSEETSITTIALAGAETYNVDLVEVPLRVRASRAITASDLRLRENGVEQTIRDVKSERPSAHFAFVIDRSLSMGNGKLDAALRAVQSAMRQLRPGDTSSLVVFNHNVTKTSLAEARRLVPSGGTSLRDALASIASKERTYAIVITDGGDRNSALSEETALRKISGTRTTVHAIVLGDAHARFLDRAAENTGGAVIEASRDTVASALQRILADINSRYLIVYQSAGTKRGWRAIDVQPRRNGVAITSARKGYFAE